MAERRNHERRKWGRKVTYPFIDSDGVLVTKNRRRLVDRRVASTDVTDKKPTPPTLSDVQPSLDISESKVMELEEALKEDEGPTSKIEESIKDLESQILTQTEKVALSDVEVEDSSKKNKDPDTNKTSDANKTKAKSDPEPTPLPTEDKSNNGTSIEISFKGNKHVLSEDQKTCQVGRDPSCDIIVQGKYVSRAHAKIICKKGKFFLQDDSFNGTYIKFNNGQKIHVLDNEQTLISDGVMSMGEPIKDTTKSIIQFKILE